MLLLNFVKIFKNWFIKNGKELSKCQSTTLSRLLVAISVFGIVASLREAKRF